MVAEIAAALAAQIADAYVADDEIQVLDVYRAAPSSKACIDLYSADPAQEDAAFGPTSSLLAWTVRARISSADDESAQRLLYELSDTAGAMSIRAALFVDKTLGGLAEGLDCDRPSGLRPYQDQTGTSQGIFLGFEMRVRVYASNGFAS